MASTRVASSASDRGRNTGVESRWTCVAWGTGYEPSSPPPAGPPAAHAAGAALPGAKPAGRARAAPPNPPRTRRRPTGEAPGGRSCPGCRSRPSPTSFGTSQTPGCSSLRRAARTPAERGPCSHLEVGNEPLLTAALHTRYLRTTDDRRPAPSHPQSRCAPGLRGGRSTASPAGRRLRASRESLRL